MLEAADIRKVLSALLEPMKNTRSTRHADLALRAMTLLGVSGGLEQTDCAHGAVAPAPRHRVAGLSASQDHC